MIICEMADLTSLLFIEIQWNGLLRAKGVVILNTGHNLTPIRQTLNNILLFSSSAYNDSYFDFK